MSNTTLASKRRNIAGAPLGLNAVKISEKASFRLAATATVAT
ncbi:hypothetical protein [Polynucleobacter necessarius]|nr:hypothetical protein [Polynucleobacter necessarius]